MIKAIKCLISDCSSKREQLNIAVAYWGNNAVEETGLQKRIETNPTNVRVICDLRSGACNPNPIQKLRKLGSSVMTVDGMHAKVWVCADAAIVGSANVSANGLGFDESESNHEAAVFIRDPQFAATVNAWFDGLWEKEGEIVSDGDLERARKQWEQRNCESRNRLNDYKRPDFERILFKSRRQNQRNFGVIQFFNAGRLFQTIRYSSHAGAVQVVLRELTQDYSNDDLLHALQEKGPRIESTFHGKRMPILGNDCNKIYSKRSGKGRNHGPKPLGCSGYWLTNDTGSKEKMDLIKSACRISDISIELDESTKYGY